RLEGHTTVRRLAGRYQEHTLSERHPWHRLDSVGARLRRVGCCQCHSGTAGPPLHRHGPGLRVQAVEAKHCSECETELSDQGQPQQRRTRQNSVDRAGGAHR
ncbi:hypothetical protein LTR16_008096, partial [Cryomyces antarcticus]